MLYQLHELTRNLLAPWVHQAQANAKFFANPGHWWSQMPGADRLAAVNELFHRIGKDYEKPEWGINEIEVDGERVQNGSSKTMIFGCAYLVHYISQFMRLDPGDVITTGTPPGVGLGFKPPRFLKGGEVVTLGIEGLGEQKQNFVAYKG